MKTRSFILASSLLLAGLPALAAGPNSNVPPAQNPTDAAVQRTNKRADKADAKVTHTWRKGTGHVKSGAKKTGRATGRGLRKTGQKIDEGGRKLEKKSR